MKERLKAPELRFDGFTDDWEQRKFADFIDVKSGKDYKHQIGRASCRERVSSPV